MEILTVDREIQPLVGTRRLCGLCVADLERAGYKNRKNTLSKQKTQCQICSTAVCQTHRIQVCGNCSVPLRVTDPVEAQPEEDEV